MRVCVCLSIPAEIASPAAFPLCERRPGILGAKGSVRRLLVEVSRNVTYQSSDPGVGSSRTDAPGYGQGDTQECDKIVLVSFLIAILSCCIFYSIFFCFMGKYDLNLASHK